MIFPARSRIFCPENDIKAGQSLAAAGHLALQILLGLALVFVGISISEVLQGKEYPDPVKFRILSLAGIGMATLLAIPGKSHEESWEGIPALRTFEFIQTACVTPPATGEEIRLWIPLPKAGDPFQTAEILELSSPWPTRISRDSLGNRILHVQADGAAAPFTVQVRTRVVRERSAYTGKSRNTHHIPAPCVRSVA